MPKGFNEQEKQTIQAALISEGQKLFSQYGLKKTSIKDITNAVGIAQGSFYIFYSSKEELYFDILELEEQKIKEQFFHVEIAQGLEPKKTFKKLLRYSIQLIEENSIIRQIHFDNNMDAIVRKLPPEKLQSHFNKDSDALMKVILKWQAAGVLLQKNPEVIAGLLRSLFLLTLHKKEIGEAVFDETLELLIDSIVDGIIIQEG